MAASGEAPDRSFRWRAGDWIAWGLYGRRSGMYDAVVTHMISSSVAVCNVLLSKKAKTTSYDPLMLTSGQA